MKLSFTTLGCPGWDFDKILSEAAEMGYEGIEIRGLDGEMSAGKIKAFFPENEAATKNALKAKNLEICGFGTSINLHDEKQYDQNMEEGKNTIDICRRMGIPAIRVFGNSIPANIPREKTITLIIKGLKELCSYAEDKEVLVLLEIHGEFNTIENVTAVTDKVDSPAFGILWDIAHSDITYGKDFILFYDKIKHLVKHVHVKDHKNDGDKNALCLMGKGDVPVPEIINELRKNSYDGYLSFEWEKKWVPELEEPEVAFPQYMNYMKKII